ncbi:MAG: CBS domain-containing protein [Elusimicrobia bacterium]|nr:CBS domain-containing protein [Elusimicrobiota bacterium]
MKKGLVARDVMRRTVVIVSQDADVWEIARLFTTNNVTEAPVVDAAGTLLGVVSQTDIVRHLREVIESCQRSAEFYADAEPDVGKAMRKRITAADLISDPPIEADEDTPVVRLSQMMLARGIHRIIISRDAKVRGVVTMMDLLKVL